MPKVSPCWCFNTTARKFDEYTIMCVSDLATRVYKKREREIRTSTALILLPKTQMGREVVLGLDYGMFRGKPLSMHVFTR